MRVSRVAPVVLSAACVLAAVPHARAGGALGGGFIEFLATGNASSAPPPAYRQSPPLPAVQRPYAAIEEPRRAVVAGPVQQAYASPAQVDPRRAIDPKYMRQEVDFRGSEEAGSIVVDTPNRFLYFVLGGGRAMRYGIGVGRPGFEWAGVKTITRKAEWPGWTPPPEMLLRRPDLPRHMDGGPENPLGARAMYLGSSLYRLHGTNEPWTIGQNVSSGCIRLMNEDVEDLYDRVRVGTKVRVI